MKRISAVILTFIIAVLLAFSASAVLLGDVNGDGRLTASDARQILRFSAGLSAFSQEQIALSDMNGDGKVNAGDARKVLRISASLEKPQEKESVNLESSGNDEKLTPSEIYKKASLFTAEIITYNESGAGLTIGSGFFIEENIIVTDLHVINGAHFAKVKTYRGETYNVLRVLGFDKGRDIAILETDGICKAVAKAGEPPETGDTVYVLGSTKGYTGTFTHGMVSCGSRVIEELGNGVSYIQFTAPVAEGNSGGPVLNESGNVVGIVALTNDAGQNLNFALPVTEIEKTDISSPCTLAEVSKMASEADFSGEIVLSYPAVTLKKGGTALLYALVSATDEYRLTCETDNVGIKAQTGRSYGNVNVIYVSADADSASGKVRIYIDGHDDIFAVLDVTVGNEAPEVYGGINGAVPDFGSFTGVSPAVCDENTLEGKNAYSFAYSFDDLNANGVNREECINGYRRLLEDNGYKFVSASENNTNISFYNEKTATTVTLGITTDDNGSYYMFVLILR